jgi:Base plate wedge protein 53
MSETYFQNFKSISYGNNQVVDITERAVILSNLQRNPFVYYPQDITNGARADQLAYSYYEDSYTSWIIYLSNNIIDPYYEWYLDDYQFNNFIADKYGSVQKASEKIAYYINNWIDQNDTTIAAFEAMTAGQQKYWEPIYNNFGKITSYSRKKQDWKVETNRVMGYEPVSFYYTAPTNGAGHEYISTNSLTAGIPNPDWVTKIRSDINKVTIKFANGASVTPTGISGPSPSTNIYTFTGAWAADTNAFPIVLMSTYGADASGFIKDEIVNIQYSNSEVGKGCISFSSNSFITLQNMSGYYEQPGGYIYGTESKTTVYFSNVTYLANTIPSDEAVYWQEQSYLDVEMQKNEGNKTVRMLQPRYAPQFVRNAKQILGG